MDESSNSNRVALISGANRGIGAEIAKELVSHGFRVSLGARRPESLVECHGPETGDMVYNAFDAFDRSSAEEWVKNTVRHFNRIDALVNNAGSDERVSITDDNEEALDRLWEVNVKAPLRMCRLCLPHLEQTGRGRIINISSLSGKRAKNEFVGYNMTKFAMMGLTHTVRLAAWDKGVRATAICPSFVRTRMSAYTDKVKPEDMIQPETIAHLVRTTIELPNNAAIAELLINYRHEDTM